MDTQKLLPNGSEDDVRNEVRRLIKILAPGSSYVLSAVHNILYDVPPENIIAMFDEAYKYGKYSLRDISRYYF